MKIITVVGARPQFIKAAPVSREIRKYAEEILVHTGQHYDKNMSDIFFNELNIPKPNYNLNVGSGSHGKQTGEMLIKLEELIINERPDYLMVYGDTNSTLAGAIAASKLHIPVIHIEAGLRSYNKLMPEEQNRILTDHISSFLFCPTNTAILNLQKENILEGVYNTGDVMYDSVLYNINLSNQKYKFDECMGNLKPVIDIAFNNKNILPNNYILATIHRAENTDGLEKLSKIIEALHNCSLPIIFPVHPRIRNNIAKVLKLLNINKTNIKFVEPVGYLEMLMLTQNAKKVVTDSGGLQKEAYFLNTPCVTLRDQTEWVETLENGWNVLCEIDIEKILYNINMPFIKNDKRATNNFGDGNAASHIAQILFKV